MSQASAGRHISRFWRRGRKAATGAIASSTVATSFSLAPAASAPPVFHSRQTAATR
jgi:hypothetical protein